MSRITSLPTRNALASLIGLDAPDRPCAAGSRPGPASRGSRDRPVASHCSTSSLASASGFRMSLASQFIVTFEVLHAQPQVVELPSGLFLDRLRQPRRKDACARPPRRRSARGCDSSSWSDAPSAVLRASALRQAFCDVRLTQFAPLRSKSRQRVAALLHLARVAGLARPVPISRLARWPGRPARCGLRVGDELLARLARDPARRSRWAVGRGSRSA